MAAYIWLLAASMLWTKAVVINPVKFYIIDNYELTED